ALTTVPTVTEEEIKLMVDTGGKEGAIEEGEREMIYGVFELGELTVGDIMSPRVDIITLESDSTLADAIHTSSEHGYSRIPVYEETIDNIKGVVYVKDILPYVESDKLDTLVRDVMREPYFIPESKKVSDFLQEMRQKRVHAAICVDEFGGVAGLVTIEDVLEEIVGEIQDEHDVEEPQVEMVNELEAVVDPAISMHDLNDSLGISLENEEVDTLGGIIFAHLGRMADEGDELQLDGITVSVLAVEGRRIKKVLVRKEPHTETVENGAETDEGSREG
ncbi:MAG: hemolysin family protein, partial [Chloroflexota bacterium]|nr:hemolysin family protein [Chloroflexota bacterium]